MFMYGSYPNNWAAKLEFPVHSGEKERPQDCLSEGAVMSERFSAVTGKKSGNHPPSGRADLHKTPAHSALSSQIIASAWQADQELTGKCCLASCDFCLKMLSPRTVLLGALKYSLFNFMIESFRGISAFTFLTA